MYWNLHYDTIHKLLSYLIENELKMFIMNYFKMVNNKYVIRWIVFKALESC